MFVPIKLTKRQRQIDLCIAVVFQAISLILACELEHAKVALPVVGVVVGAYVAASVTTLYVLVVSEFKPVLMETVASTYWILCNVLFSAVLFLPAVPRQAEPEAHVHQVQREIRRMEVEKIKAAWGQLSQPSRETILERIDEELKEN